MRRESPITLVRPLDNSLVDGSLVVGVTIDEIDEAVGLWTPYMEDAIQKGAVKPDHAHWQWDKKARAVKGSPEYSFTGVFVKGEMQALMLREQEWKRAKHPDQKGSSLVYVCFLSTAPWNDIKLVPTPSFRGAGTILMTEAVNHSLSLGYKGRLGLHALSGSEEFYRDRCGMTDLGPDPDPAHQGLTYFEFTPDSANEFLNQQVRQSK